MKNDKQYDMYEKGDLTNHKSQSVHAPTAPPTQTQTKTLTNQDHSAKTRRLTMFAMFLTLELLLIFTPLGFVPLGAINATTLHIPVILAGILMGPLEGAGLGLVFGLSSLIRNTVAPNLTSFVFSPFVTVGAFSGNAWSIWVAIGPRILLGLLAALIFRLLHKYLKLGTLAAGISAGLSTFLHTIMVMGSIYFLFGQEYAAAQNMTQAALLGLIGTVISVNGVAELILAAVVVMAVYAVTAVSRRQRKAKAPHTTVREALSRSDESATEPNANTNTPNPTSRKDH